MSRSARSLAAAGLAALALGGPAQARAGEAWLAPEVVAPADLRVDDPAIAFGADGRAIAVWSRVIGRTTEQVQVSERPEGGPWSVPRPLTPDGVAGVEPEVAIDGSGRVTVVWRVFNGGIWAADRAPGGTWSEPVRLSATGTDVHVAAGANGDTTAIWKASGLKSASHSQTGGWGAVQTVAPSEFPPGPVDLDVSDDGTAFAIWMNEDERIRTGMRRAGTWSAPVSISPPGGDVDSPSIAAGPEGSAMAVWAQDLGQGHHVRNAVYENGQWSVDTLSAPADEPDPQVALGPDGVAAVVWHSDESTIVGVATGSKGLDDPVTLSTPGRRAGGADVAVSGEGRVLATWSEGAIAVSERTRETDWSAARTVSSGDGSEPHVAWDAQGNALAGWADLDAGSTLAISAAGFDSAPPVIDSVLLPSAPAAGTELPFAADVHDVWSPFTTTWSFDGEAEPSTGTTVSRAFDSPGTRAVGVEATDALGNSARSAADIDVAARPPAPPGVVPGPASPPPAVPPPDRTGPRLTLRLSGARLRSVLAHGFVAKVSCSEACTLVERLRHGRSTVARGKARLAKAGTSRLVLKLSRRERKRLARSRRVRLSFVVEAVDTAGNKTRKSAAVALRR